MAPATAQRSCFCPTAHWVSLETAYLVSQLCGIWDMVHGCHTGVRSPGSSSLDRIPASGHGFPPPPAPPPPLSRPKQAPTLGATPLPPQQAAAPALACHPCQQQAASSRHTRDGLTQYAPWPSVPYAPQSSPRYFIFTVDPGSL